ncbi:MAG TPA: hypothetical protein VFK04_01045 [Gemmatimonadaceae bacterium]|nr:hypothetical protein [Gemmatimonadaceae bacterium]
MRIRPTIVALEIAGLTLLITGCAHGRSRAPLPSNPVAVQVGAHVVSGSPDQLVLNIAVTNTTRDTLQLDLADGSSIASIRLYDTASGTTRAAYDEGRRLFVNPQTGAQGAMVGTGLIVWLAPGKSDTFRRAYTVPSLLGDTLPGGAYRVGVVFGADVTTEGGVAGPPIDSRERDAGVVQLRAVPIPLAAARPAGGVVVMARTAVLDSGPPTVVRVVVTGTSIGGTPASLDLPRAGCPLELLVFSTRAERDSVLDRVPVRTLASTECDSVHGRVEVAPGKRGTLAALTVDATDILGDSLPGGRYYFAARLARAGEAAVLLSAGEAELRRR